MSIFVGIFKLSRNINILIFLFFLYMVVIVNAKCVYWVFVYQMFYTIIAVVNLIIGPFKFNVTW